MNPRTLSALPILLLVACSDPGGATSDAAIVYDAGPPDAPPDAALPTFDCATVPASPVSVKTIDGARGYHGLAITPEGKMLGSYENGLIQTTYAGVSTLFSPEVGDGEQMAWLADGDLIMSVGLRGGDVHLVRISPAGQQTAVALDANAYAVVVGPDDAIYTATWDEGTIYRIDPNTGNKTEFLEGYFGEDVAHTLGFSPDGKRLYIGTLSFAGSGIIYYVDLDDDVNVVGDFKVLATEVGEGWHDAVGVDACGNLYVPDYNSGNLYRVSPGGAVTTYWVPPDGEDLTLYPHSIVWGTGEHGWRDDAIYLSQPYNDNTVVEIVVGAPSSEFEGILINAPTPI